MHDWERFARCGDEWFIAYASMGGVLGPMYFALGHTVELYLKSAHLKLFSDMKRTMKHGHKLTDIWEDCKNHDSDFMDEYSLRKGILAIDLFDKGQVSGLSSDDRKHFKKNEEFYVVMRHLQDLKYVGLPWKTRTQAPRGFNFLQRNPYWVTFFRSMRTYLNYPVNGRTDWVKVYTQPQPQLLKGPAPLLPTSAVYYLQKLYQ